MKMLDKEQEIFVDDKRVRPENSEVFELVSDNSKAKKVLNWQPRLTFNEGLLETISFVKNNLDFYKSNLYNI
jgi:GDP-D-mannose dehydratase